MLKELINMQLEFLDTIEQYIAIENIDEFIHIKYSLRLLERKIRDKIISMIGILQNVKTRKYIILTFDITGDQNYCGPEYLTQYLEYPNEESEVRILRMFYDICNIDWRDDSNLDDCVDIYVDKREFKEYLIRTAREFERYGI